MKKLHLVLTTLFIFNIYPSNTLNTKLMQAISDGDISAVRETLDAGADINYVDQETKDTPTAYAIKNLLKMAFIANKSIRHMGLSGKLIELFAWVSTITPTVIGLCLDAQYSVEIHGVFRPYWKNTTNYLKPGLFLSLSAFIVNQIGIHLYRKKIGKTIPERKEILVELIRDKNFSTIDSASKKQVLALLESILDPEYIADLWMTVNGIPTYGPYGRIYAINCGNSNYQFAEKYLSEFINPLFLDIYQELLDRQKRQ